MLKLMIWRQKMKIIALQGSPRVGGNCDVLMDEMIKGAEENGHEVVKYYLEKQDIAACKACMYCAEHGECVRGDDRDIRNSYLLWTDDRTGKDNH